MTTTKTRTNINVGQAITTQTGLDMVSKMSIAAMGMVSVIIGVSATACFIGAMITTGGPLQLAQSWFSAITGM